MQEQPRSDNSFEDSGKSQTSMRDPLRKTREVWDRRNNDAANRHTDRFQI